MNFEGNIKITLPLSGRGKPVLYIITEEIFSLKWGNITFSITYEQVSKILKKYFLKANEWYPLGASMTQPISGGLGEFIQREIPPLGPRHASAIAAMMVNEAWLEAKGKNPIMLRRVVTGLCGIDKEPGM